MQAPPINQHEAQEIFDWLETMTFSRSPKNLSRDFSDGVLMAQIMRQQYPNLVHLHNYQPTNSSSSKYINWKTLNEKVFRKLGFQINRSDIQSIINNVAGTIQRVLHFIYTKITTNKANMQNQNASLAMKLSEMSYANNTNGSINTKKQLLIEEEQHQKNLYTKQISSQLAEKEEVIKELRQTLQILEIKMKKMEQLSKLKDAKIDSLMKKLDEGIGL